MTRRLQASGVDYLANTSTYKIAHLLRLELASSTPTTKVYSYLTDYLDDISYGGNLYVAGKVLEVKDIKESEGFKNNKTSVIVAGEFQEELDKALADLNNSSYENREVTILKVYFGEDGNIIPLGEDEDAISLFQGFITSLDVREDITRGSSKVTWKCGSYLQDFEKVSGRLTSHDAHTILYPTDTGFQHANQTLNMIASYNAKETKYKTKRNWLGMVSGVREYSVDVERELTLGVSLDAERIPVIYGVRKTAGIPVFVDVDKTDPSKVTVIYAICEGEISGYLNLYLDGESVMCLDKKPSEANCFESQKMGYTLSALQNSDNGALISKFYKGSGNIEDYLLGDTNFPVTPGSNTASTSSGDTITIANSKSTYNLVLYNGEDGQVADPGMVAKAAAGDFLLQQDWTPPAGKTSSAYWDADSKLTSTAYIKCEFRISDKVTAIPELEAVVDGKLVRVYDTPSTYTEQKTLNPVWHTLDYLNSPSYGGNLPTDSVNIQSAIDVATRNDVIDTSYEPSWVEFWRYTGWDDQLGSNRTMIQCNTLIPTGNTVSNNISTLLAQFDGTLCMVNGKFEFTTENADTSVYTIPVEDSQGVIDIKNDSSRKKWNTIKANIINPAKNWDSSSISYFDQTYLTQDNDVSKSGNVSFSNITNYYTARAKAIKALKASRYSRKASLTVGPKYSNLAVNDNIKIDYPRFFGNTPQDFRVTEIVHKSNGMIGISCKMYDPSVFTSEQADQVPPATVDRGTITVPTGLTYVPLPDVAYPISLEEDVMGALVWDTQASDELLKYEVTYGTESKDVSKSQIVSGKNYFLLPSSITPDVAIAFRVRAVSNRGSFSTYETIVVTPTTAEVIPAKPDKVTNIQVANLVDGQVIDDNIAVTWDASSQVSTYEVEVLNTSEELLRSTTLGSPQFTYTQAMNLADYSTKNAGKNGVFRELKIRIRATDGGSKKSDWAYV